MGSEINVIAFPTADHVTSVCKPGKNQCRYLLNSTEGYTCGLNTFPEITRGENTSGSINCKGFLEKITEFKNRLIGNLVRYTDLPFFDEKGTLDNIQVTGGVVAMKISCDNLGPLDSVYQNPKVLISNDGVTFVASTHGTPLEFSERIKIEVPIETEVVLQRETGRQGLRRFLPF